MSDQFKLDINLGPFRLMNLPMNVQLIRCDDDIFDENELDLYDESLNDAFLYSLKNNNSEKLARSIDNNRIIYTTYRATRYWITTKGDFADWLDGLAANTRQSIRRKRRKLAKAAEGTLQVRRFDKPDEMAEFYQCAREVSRTTFHERKLGLGLPADQAFYERMKSVAENGDCFGSLMSIHGQPVSYIYCVMRGQRCEPIYRGFDPSFKQLSPGFLHHVAIIEEAFQQPDCDFIDFGLSAFQYKEQLSTDQADCENVLVLSKTIRHRAAVTMHRMMAGLTSWVSQHIEKWGAKARLRQWLRGTAA